MPQRLFGNPATLSDMGAALCAADGPELQAVMDEANIVKRLRLSLDLLKKEQEVSRVQEKIRKDVETKVRMRPCTIK